MSNSFEIHTFNFIDSFQLMSIDNIDINNVDKSMDHHNKNCITYIKRQELNKINGIFDTIKVVLKIKSF